MSIKLLTRPNSLELNIKTAPTGINLNKTVIQSSELQDDYTYQLPTKPTLELQPVVMVSQLQEDGKTVTTSWVSPEEAGIVPPDLQIDNLVVANNTTLNNDETGTTVVKGLLDNNNGSVETGLIKSTFLSQLKNIRTNSLAITNINEPDFDPPYNILRYEGNENVINLFPIDPITNTTEDDTYVMTYQRTGGDIQANYTNFNNAILRNTYYRNLAFEPPHVVASGGSVERTPTWTNIGAGTWKMEVTFVLNYLSGTYFECSLEVENQSATTTVLNQASTLSGTTISGRNIPPLDRINHTIPVLFTTTNGNINFVFNIRSGASAGGTFSTSLIGVVIYPITNAVNY